MNKKSVTILSSAVLALSVSSVHGDVLTSWTFNTGTTSTDRLASSGTVSGLTVSQLFINDNHDDFGVGVPNTVNDGFGFGGNSGEQNMFFHRADYFNSSAPAGERTTWGNPVNDAGVDTTVLNAPISFSVSTDASTSATIESLFYDGISPTTFLWFQEAGATAGSSVTASSANSFDATVLLNAPIVIGPNETITFTLNVSSGNLNSGHIVNQLDLQGTTNVIPEPSQAGLLIGAVGLLWIGIRRRRA